MSTILRAPTVMLRGVRLAAKARSPLLGPTTAVRAYQFDPLPGGGGSGSGSGSGFLGGFGGGGGGGPSGKGFAVHLWPRTMVNTGVCVCPQGERMVVERFGKMHDLKEPG